MGLTPLMKQYWEIKNQHTDKVLLFRMGDFFEMFHQDAEVAAPILNIALTSRNKKAKDDTPMCGVPHHSIATPISKLLAAGHKVAICDQLEDPSLAKGIVKRGVTRVLTPGMVYDPETLEEEASNFVAAFDDKLLVLVDPSTGTSWIYELELPSDRRSLLQLLQPREVVLTAGQRAQLESLFIPEAAHISVFERILSDLPADFQELPEVAKRLLSYAVDLQGKEILSSLRGFERKNLSRRMKIRPTTLRHLEIFESYRGQKEGSLFHAINRTKSSSGARLLKNWLQFPLRDLEEIGSRQQEIRFWQADMGRLKRVRDLLGKMGDIERRLTKIAYSTCHPRDLLALHRSLTMGLQVSDIKGPTEGCDPAPARFVVDLIERSISEEPPAQMKKGGFIQKGYSPELDQLIHTAENSAQLILELEACEKEATGIPSLKVRYNSVFGYYIEVTNTHRDKVPAHYSRKQTLANAERYITEELNSLESRVLAAKAKRLELEETLFQSVRHEILQRNRELLGLASLWSSIDLLAAMAWLALEQNYVLPKIVEEGELLLKGSRHPVVEQEVSRDFVPNDISLKAGDCLLLTGPNMAGKSTLMRQVALNVLLGQIGAVVPCKEAQIPLVDQIFTRIGASDFLAEGLSTFMVEMQETAELLEGLTDKSLVILDEIGRGTSTYDGMSLAQAILEYLIAQKGVRTLFATHYHELTSIQAENLYNAHMAIYEQGNRIEFLYGLKKGAASKSYGIHVAELAGLPQPLVARAKALLQQHESAVVSSPTEQLSLGEWQEVPEVSPVPAPEPSIIDRELMALDVNALTPLEALNKLYQWRQELS